MRTIGELHSYSKLEQVGANTQFGFFNRLGQKKLAVMLVLVAVAFCARVVRLDAPSLAEDEANKIFAIRSYQHGDFTANTEHPMLLKLTCYASMQAASLWNRAAGARLGLQASDELALRLPNATLGALTVIPLLLLGGLLLGFRTGLIAAALWAMGLEAIWFSRIVKEDTLFVFFMLSGFYLYLKAKHRPAWDLASQERLYALAGGAFGLMIASKYFPHYVGLNALFYTLIGYDSLNNRPLTRRMWLGYFGGLLLTFSVFNFAVFAPQTWRYLLRYVNEEMLTHHGYLVMDRLFLNDVSQTPGGTPWYFYLLFMWVKLPVPLLAAFAVGVVEIVRRRAKGRHARGYLFLRMMLLFWFIPMSFLGVKFLRYSLALMPLFYLTAAIGIVVIWRALSSAINRLKSADRLVPRLAAVATALVFVFAPAVSTANSLLTSYPGLWLNFFGGHRTGYFFPHDEFYDLGAREGIRYIAETAPRGARMASEIPGVVQYYLDRYNRRDITSEILSEPSFSLDKGRPEFVLLQRGRFYVENRENFNLIAKNFPVVYSSVYQGAAAAQVFRLDGRRFEAKDRSQQEASPYIPSPDEKTDR